MTTINKDNLIGKKVRTYITKIVWNVYKEDKHNIYIKCKSEDGKNRKGIIDRSLFIKKWEVLKKR
jgi:hypothetical protein